MNRDRLIIFCSLPLLPACAEGAAAFQEGEADEPAELRQADHRLQGRTLQGRTLQGTETGVAVVLGIRLGGTDVTELRLQGTKLVGTLDGTALAGADFIGATVIQQAPDGRTFLSTLQDLRADPEDPSGETLLYTLMASDPDTGMVENLCAPDAAGQRVAIPVAGVWDRSGAHQSSSTQFTFGCTSGVIAKCVSWGYRPWKSVNGVSLVDYHQACTRMARADYCGNGVSHTAEGTLIDVYDKLRIQTRAPTDLLSPLIFDAAWTPQGAYCMTKVRWISLSQLVSVATSCKLRFADLFPLLESSPVDSRDVCGVKRTDLNRSSVLMDNRSGLNVALF